jgi:hypothetical protein
MKQIYPSTAHRLLLLGVIAAILILLLTGTVLAQSSPNYTLEWYLIGGSGQVSGSDQFLVVGTAAQSAAGPPYPHSLNYVVSGGFWLGDSPPTFDWVYLPLTLRNY